MVGWLVSVIVCNDINSESKSRKIVLERTIRRWLIDVSLIGKSGGTDSRHIFDGEKMLKQNCPNCCCWWWWRWWWWWWRWWSDYLCRPSDCHHCRIPSRRGCDDHDNQMSSSKRQDRFVLFQVKGKSAFNFFNAEDLPWTTMAMRHSKLYNMQSALGLVHI